jgi:hypothetical protein
MMARFGVGLLAAVLIVGCRSREVEKDLQLTDVHTGWYDVGIVGGKNKLVPSIALRLKNVSSEPISRVQINAVFRQIGEDASWGAPFVRGIGPDGLAPGATGELIVLLYRNGIPSPDAPEQPVRRRERADLREARLAHVGEDGGVQDRPPAPHRVIPMPPTPNAECPTLK